MIQTALKIDIRKISKSRISEMDHKNLQFGKFFSDHMFVADFENGEWRNAQILPYGKMEISPSNSAFHYGQAIFEGMKAYKTDTGSVNLFRPEANWRRLNISAERMAMPNVPEE
ncbi:MAG TPA: branched chain amino acid aminotransferase, partial [Bacteroidia bacterium]|nr:branched chain amino acid aminotransferase [Bacteroidia bacterium]